MKPFKFSLEKVLALRKFREDETKIELGRAVGLLAEIEMNIRKNAEERVRASSAQFKQGNSAIEMERYMYYILRLDNSRETMLNDAALAEIKVEEARSIFLEASRDRKVLDKLMEKRLKEYNKAKLENEIKVLDDISSGVLARKALTA